MKSTLIRLGLCCLLLLVSTLDAKATNRSHSPHAPRTSYADPTTGSTDIFQRPVAASSSTVIFNYADFSNVSGLNFMVDAAAVNNRARVTPAKPDQLGAVWYNTPQYVQGSFETSFQFQITDPGPGNDPDGNPGADGFAFVIQNYSAVAVGGGGGSIGYGSLPNSLAVEFDTWNNGPDNHNGDPNGNHISVQTRGTDMNSSDHAYSLGAVTTLPNMSDAAIHTATIRYQAGVLTVYLDNPTTPVLSVAVDLSTRLHLADGLAWVGFTSATGNYENHDILSWSFQGNTPPQAQAVTINPTAPVDNVNLTLSYSYVDAENNPENTSLTEIRWYRYDTLQSAFNNQLTVSQDYTYLGEEWCATVRPHDGIVYGLAAESNCVVIGPDGNQLPQASNPAISPANPTSSDNLILSYLYSDPDSDPEANTEIFWYRDARLQPAYNNVTAVSAASTIPGEVWWATVRPHDGKDYGVKVSTAPVKIVAPAVNTAPQVDSVQINPAQPGVDDHLELTYNYFDVDGDPEGDTEIFWYRNLVHQTYLDGIPFVPSYATAVDDIWFALVLPYDGDKYGPYVAAQSVKILPGAANTRPVVREVYLAPETPGPDDNLRVLYQYYDADGDPEGATQIRWLRDGAPAAFNDLTTVPASATSAGQVWCAVITPYDNRGAAGPPVTSNCVTITVRTNAAPTAREVHIEPGRPASTDPLKLVYEFFDPDGDTQKASRIRWYKDNVLQSGFNDTTRVPAEATGPGQVWVATVEPHDGFSYGPLITAASVTINTPPHLDAATLAEASGGLKVSAGGYSDADGDPPGLPNINWYENTVLQPEWTDLEWVSTCGTQLGDNWLSTVAPHDGVEYGPVITSNTIALSASRECLYLPVVMNALVVENLCNDFSFNEDNDSRAQSCRLSPGVTYPAYPDDAEDVYYFILEETSAVSLRVTNYYTSMPGQLLLYDSYNNRDSLVGIQNLQGTGDLPNPSAPRALANLPPGKYYVRVYTFPGHFNTTTPYQLVLNITPL